MNEGAGRGGTHSSPPCPSQGIRIPRVRDRNIRYNTNSNIWMNTDPVGTDDIRASRDLVCTPALPESRPYRTGLVHVYLVSGGAGWMKTDSDECHPSS